MIQRTFIPGDEWLYYKLYCGKRTADTVLINIIKPLTEHLLANKLIDKWFFIRYSDPDAHLRIRFHCNDTNKIGEVMLEVKKAIQNYVDNDLIWKVVIDSYQREIERYGMDTMLFSEELFYLDSTVCLKALDLIKEDYLLFMFALRSIDIIFKVFNFTLPENVTFCKENLEAFKVEFNSNKSLNRQLNKKYQGIKHELIYFMDLKNSEEYQILIDILDEKNNNLTKLKDNLFDKRIKDVGSIKNILSSHIHMIVNRIFRDKQRLHELICYHALSKYYSFRQKN